MSEIVSAAAAGFAALQNLTTREAIAEQGTEAFGAIVLALQTPNEVPVHVRVKCLAVVEAKGGYFEIPLLRKAVTSVVGVLAGEDNTPLLLLAAIKALVGICFVAVPKAAEFVVREGCDVLMQIVLDRRAFSAPVRDAANGAVQKLLSINFTAVVTKLLHWISDERADDDPAVLQAERDHALLILSQLVTDARFASSWTAESEAHVLQYAQLVFNTVTTSEFDRLIGLLSKLSTVRSKKCETLVTATLSKVGNDQRGWECIDSLSRVLPSDLEAPAVFEHLASSLAELGGPSLSDESSVALAKAILVAAKTADSGAAPKLVRSLFTILDSLVCMVDEGLPRNLTVIEAILLSINTAAAKSGSSFLSALGRDGVLRRLGVARDLIANKRAELMYAYKRQTASAPGTTRDFAITFGCLDNIVAVLESWLTKRLMRETRQLSIVAPPQLPKLAKRTRETAAAPVPAKPKEVIVVDDDDDEELATKRKREEKPRQQQKQNKGQQQQQQQQQQQGRPKGHQPQQNQQQQRQAGQHASPHRQNDGRRSESRRGSNTPHRRWV